MEPKREKRGQRMNPERKKMLVKTAPVVAMKICGPISQGSQLIASKCLKAVQFFKERYTGKELENELRNHLYKDIERVLYKRRAKREREYTEQTQCLNREINKVTPRALQKTRSSYYS